MNFSEVIKKYYPTKHGMKKVPKHITVEQAKQLLSDEPDNPFNKIIMKKIPVPQKAVNLNILATKQKQILLSKNYNDLKEEAHVAITGIANNTLLYHNPEASIIRINPVFNYTNMQGKFKIEKYKSTDDEELHLINASLPYLGSMKNSYYYLIESSTGSIVRLKNINHAVSQALYAELGTPYRVDVLKMYVFYTDYSQKCTEPYYELRNFKPISVNDSSFEGKLAKVLSILNTTMNYKKLLTLTGYRKVISNKTKYVKIYKCGGEVIAQVKNKRRGRVFTLRRIRKL